MSKRRNMQAKRRQVRRALNRNPEFYKGVSHTHLNSRHYGQGVKHCDMKEDVREHGSVAPVPYRGSQGFFRVARSIVPEMSA